MTATPIAKTFENKKLAKYPKRGRATNKSSCFPL
jgi:hypothetical protein